MKRGAGIFLIVTVLAFMSSAAGAQSVSLPYFNGWEDAAENAMWEMNSGMNGAAAKNRWYVSSKESFSGRHSLLISDLSLSPDTAAVYSNSTVSIVAARTFMLPRGQYELSFVWRAYGEKGKDGLHVAWIDDMEDISTSLIQQPAWAATALPYKGKMFSNQSAWKTESVTITSQGVPMKLVFLWVNDGQTCVPPPVCIDDVQIAPANCGRPEKIKSTVTGDDVSLTWTQAQGSTCEVRYTSPFSGREGHLKNIRSGSVTVNDLPNGVYNFQVRVICAPGDTGIWHSHPGVVVSTGMCIDYITLDAPEVTCYLNNSPSDQDGFYVGIDSEGSSSEPSRHTVITAQGETDPLTGGMLPTVPDGEFVSVRLGNDEPRKSEAIEYTMALDSGSNTILLMKYAVVLEVPGGHEDYEMPKFHLEILDANGKLIDPICGEIDFFASLALLEDGWHQSPVEKTAGFPIIYKDWTTLGVNLSDYAAAGDTRIKIRLVTNDCTLGEHFGYAYFTISCSEASIKGQACGEHRTEEIIAPDGFTYRWYKTYAPDEPIPNSDQRVLDIADNDTSTYSCEVSSKETEGCSFILEASLLPRFPVALVSPEWCPEKCRNAVRFNNFSRIETAKGVSRDQITDFEWDFGNGVKSTEKNPILQVPDAGDTLHVSLTAYIADRLCSDMWDSTIIVPPVGPTYDTTFAFICEGGAPYIINGTPYDKPGDYPLPTAVSQRTGCDSIHVVRLSVAEAIVTEIDTALCYGDTLYVGQNMFYFSGEFTEKIKLANGCDSIVKVKLEVLPEVTFSVEVKHADNGPNSGAIVIKDTLPGTYYELNGELNAPLENLPVGLYIVECFNRLGCEGRYQVVEIKSECVEFEVGSAGEICSGDSVAYVPVTVTKGSVSCYNLRFAETAAAAGFADKDSVPMTDGAIALPLPESVRPDNYSVSVEVIDNMCDPRVEQIAFTVLYPTSVMKQKWNNVLALMNAGYNGGYDFVSYRWYRNGEVMAGETGSYIYLGDGAVFDPADEYRAELTRSGDGVTLMTCPYFAEPHEDVQPFPSATLVPPMQPVRVNGLKGEASVTVWDAGGALHGTFRLSAENPDFPAPSRQGTYILRIATGDAPAATIKIVVI